MKKFTALLFMSLCGYVGVAQCDFTNDGRCCDPDVGVTPGQDAYCAANWSSIYNGNTPNGSNSDADCGPVTDPACIPIDGGLSLLALAGGGLATAAMRRRREEKEAASQGAV